MFKKGAITREELFMKEELKKLLDEFATSLSKYQQNQYITKLRDYLLPYICDNYSDKTIGDLLTNEFTKDDIIMSTVYYVTENENVKRKSAVRDFLTAMDSFFKKVVLKKYSNRYIPSLHPFIQFEEIVNIKLKEKNIVLLEKESNPPADKEHVFFILKHFEKMETKSLMQLQTSIIIKLYLLYGFSSDVLAKQMLDDYIEPQHLLCIKNQADSRGDIILELPYILKREFTKLISIRVSDPSLDSELLFVNTKNKTFTPSQVHAELKKIKCEFEERNKIEFDKNPFTPTGLQKYAIINMILIGMNESMIGELTGQKEEIMFDCQLVVNESRMINRNRYINHMVRGIETYDLL
jgi:hypothetical protein